MRNGGFKNGFTLIEILISMAIFALLLGIVLTNFMGTKKIENLKQGALELVNNLQKAQNLALTGFSFSGSVPVGGYGVHLTLSNQYIIFADSYSTVNNCGVELADEKYNCLDKTYAAISLPAGVSICKITGSAVPSGVDLVFKAPEYRPYVDGVLGGTAEIYLKLKLSNNNVCRKVNLQSIAGRASEGTTTCPNPDCL